MQRITTIFFDAGGVLFDTFVKRSERVAGVLRSRGFQAEEIEAGLLAAEQFREQSIQSGENLNTWAKEGAYWDGFYRSIADALSHDNPEELKSELFLHTFYATNCALFSETREVLDTLAQTHRLAVISNAFPSLDWIFDYLDIRRYFETITISALVNSRKPNQEIYQHALQVTGVSAGECMFIDDKEENTLAATHLGMKGVHLDRTYDDLRSILRLL